MANTDWAFGFQPYQKLLRANYYAISTAPTIGFYHGDICGVSGANLLTPGMGYLPGLLYTAVPDGLDNLIGSIVALFDYKMDPTPYIIPATVGNSVIAGYALIADDPAQLFIGREDFDGGAIAAASGSVNANIISVALCAGNTKTGRSRQMIDSSTAATTAALNLKLYGPHPNDVSLVADDTPGASGDEGARWICQITEHYYGMPSVDGGLSA
uniref:Putative structural protein n=1 Tax=viral metagenome TaxID=1070528 RepID=A0A6M3KEY0_9ZZZZ